MLATNPVRGVRGRGDSTLRTRVLHHLVVDDVDTVTALTREVDGSRRSVSRVVSELRDEGVLDGLSMTDEGARQIRRTQRALVDHLAATIREQFDSEPDTGDIEAFVSSWTGLAPHPEPVELDTEPHLALKWMTVVLEGRPIDEVVDMEPRESPSDISEECLEWLEERETPFYLDDCPYSVPDELVEPIGGDLYRVK